ncbi:MAG: hypothetical protein ACWGQW_03535 [bacterium]
MMKYTQKGIGGGQSTNPAKTRDYSPKFGGSEQGKSRMAKGNDGKYHLQGRPSSRSGNETDMRGFR